MKLYILEMGISERSRTPFPAYLIQTEEGTTVLVDTGFPRLMVDLHRQPAPPEALVAAGAPQSMAQAVSAGRFSIPHVDARHYIVNALDAIGVRPTDVSLLVASHFDFDHVGALDAFSDAEVVVQQVHLDAARAGDPRFAATRQQWGRPDVRYRTVSGDVTLLPGIELIESSGHVPGHQSVLVRLPQTGPVLLAIDAIPRGLGDLTPETRPVAPSDASEEGTRASTRKLLDLARREGVTLTIYGHDPDQWPTLKHAPDYYV